MARSASILAELARQLTAVEVSVAGDCHCFGMTLLVKMALSRGASLIGSEQSEHVGHIGAKSA